MLVRRFDWMDNILRFERAERFYRGIIFELISLTETRHPSWKCTFISVILFFPSHSSSKAVNLSRFWISCTSTHIGLAYVITRKQTIFFVCRTLIRLAPNSRFLNCVNSSNSSIVDILFCTKYRSLSFFICEIFLMCLILLKLRSRLVRFSKSSRPLRCPMRLSYRSSSVSVGPRFEGNSIRLI